MTIRLRRLEEVRQLVGLLFLLALLWAGTPIQASAHASLLSSTPADGVQLDSSPAEVVLQFSEPVGIVDGGSSLHGDGSDPLVLLPEVSGNQVIIPLDTLDDGSYIVQWRVISADSHPISGTISFAVGDAEVGKSAINSDVPGWLDWARTVSVGLKYFGLLSSLGALLVGWVTVRQDLAHLCNLSRLLAIIGLAGIVLEIPLTALVQRGASSASFPEIWGYIVNLQSNTLLAALMGIALVILMLGTAWLPASNDLKWRVSTGLMVGAAFTLILSGHSRTREPVWLMMLSDAIHVIVAAVWLGGIILLALGLLGRWRGEGFSSAETSAVAVSRFSTIAGYTAAGVAVSGMVMAIVILDSLEALYRTDYGVSLLIKIGLVGAVAALAAINRFALIPRLVADATKSLSKLRRLVTWELVLMIAIMGVTGHLVHQDPNVVVSTLQQSGPSTLYEGEESLDSDHTVRMTVKSNPGDQITVVATVIDEDRNIVLPDAELHLNWYLPDQDLGPITQSIPIDTTTGAYHGVFILPASGEWGLEVQVQVDRFTDSRTTVTIVVPD